MTRPAPLCDRIDDFLRKWEMAESTFGRLALRDGNLVASLRAGRSPTTRTVARIEAVMESHKG